METPSFFPNGGYSLFTVLHQAAGDTPGRPWVFCHPFGEEKLWSHRVFVSFARRLAAQGHPVLRFDLMGNGDSDGDSSQASLTTAISDVRCAIAHVCQMTGATTVNLLGLRLGATIASLVAEEAPDQIHQLVLWSPIVNGQAYMQELLRINLTTQLATRKEVVQDREAMVAAMRQGGSVNIDGYETTFPMYSEVSAVSLASARKRCAAPTLVVSIGRQGARPAPEFQQLADSYEHGTLSDAQEEPFWKEIGRFYDQAANLFESTSLWIEAQQ
jgi:exosortase A-associated hydrolase 2